MLFLKMNLICWFIILFCTFIRNFQSFWIYARSSVPGNKCFDQFHFWADLYESLMQNKVKNYRVSQSKLQISLLFNLFTGWELYPPQFHEKKKLGMQMWYVSIERFLMATQKSSSSRLKGFCIVHTTCTLGSNYFWIWIWIWIFRILTHLSFHGILH